MRLTASVAAQSAGRAQLCACLIASVLVAGFAPCWAQTSIATGPAGCVAEKTQAAIATGEFAQAESLLRQTLLSPASCPEAHFLLGYVLLRQNRAAESLAEYTAAARLRSPKTEDLRSVALDYVLLGDYIDAGHWIQRALELDASDSESWYVLGRIRYSTGRFQDAADAFQHVLVLQPGSVKAEDNLGLAYEGLNKAEQARDAYREAIAFGEKSGESIERPTIDLAVLLEHESDLAGAEELLARAVSLAPADPSAREHLGHVYLQRNELSQAQVQFEKAVSLSPLDARLHYLLGQVYRREGNHERANAEFARFASLNGSHSTPDFVK